MQMTKSQGVLLAKLVEQIRPDWDFPGIMAALGKAAGKGSFPDVAIAAITAAADPGARTPGVIPTDGHHWPTWQQPGTTDPATTRTRAEARAIQLRAEHRTNLATAASPEAIRAIRAAAGQLKEHTT